MKIGFYNIYNKTFDKQPSKQYNYLKPLKSDTLELSFGAKKMSENFQDDLEKMKSSEKLKNSPVAFIIPLLSSFYEGETDNRMLYSEMAKQTKDAQFYYFHMPKEEKEANNKLFRKEFKFADDVYDIVEQNVTSDNETLKTHLNVIISEYAKE